MAKITISEVCATIYCEQKTVFDRERGDARGASVRAAAVRGVADHKVFEMEGRMRQAAGHVDKRCYIATHIFGADSIEANALRSWRDKHLLVTWKGRFFVRMYYKISPRLLDLLGDVSVFNRLTRTTLSALLANGFFRV